MRGNKELKSVYVKLIVTQKVIKEDCHMVLLL